MAPACKTHFSGNFKNSINFPFCISTFILLLLFYFFFSILYFFIEKDFTTRFSFVPTCHCEHGSPEKSFRLSHPTSAWAEISNYTKYRFDCKWIWMFRAFSRSTNFSFRLLCCCCRSPRRLFFSMVLVLFSCKGKFTFSFFLALLTRLHWYKVILSHNKRHLKRLGKKTSVMCTNERAREEEKELLNGKFIHTRKMRCTQHTNMQKSHFYSLAPFHLAQSLAVSLLNALVSAECLSTVKLRKKIFTSW